MILGDRKASFIENLTNGKKIENPRMYRFLAEFKFMYCNADRPRKRNQSHILLIVN